MERKIIPLLCVTVVVVFLGGCALSADDDEIRLISPKDGAVLDVDDLAKDTCFQQGVCYYICAIVPLQWEAYPDTAIGCYEIKVYNTDSNELCLWGFFPADTILYHWRIVEENGYVGEDGSLIPDTATVMNMPPEHFPLSCDWRIDGHNVTSNLENRWRVAESEIWSFTVVKND